MPKNFHRIVVLKLQLMRDEDLKVDKIDSKKDFLCGMKIWRKKRGEYAQKFSPYRRAEASTYVG
jgi:hypothetical protein